MKRFQHPAYAKMLAASQASGLPIVHREDLTQSEADVAVTMRLRDAGKVLDIAVLDHVIIGSPHIGKGYFSFLDAGALS